MVIKLPTVNEIDPCQIWAESAPAKLLVRSSVTKATVDDKADDVRSAVDIYYNMIDAAFEARLAGNTLFGLSIAH